VLAPTAKNVVPFTGLYPRRGSPDSWSRRPPHGGRTIGRHERETRSEVAVQALRQTGREVDMKLVKRFAVALGSLLAVALAGGAHWRW
jgi:hypothetical protein